MSILTLKVRLARALTSPLVGRMVAVVFHDRIPYYGTRIRTDFPNIDPRTKASLLFHLYERAEVRFIRKHVFPGATVVELGSSLGISTLHAARAAGPTGRVVAVEADASLASVARQIIEDNGLRHVELVNAAIQGDSADAWFVPGSTTRTGRVSGSLDPATEAVRSKVPGRTLPALLAEANVTGSFVLISDIEGAEHSFIEADDVTLQRCELAVIELHDVITPVNRPWSAALDSLRTRHGFRLVEQRGPVVVLAR